MLWWLTYSESKLRGVVLDFAKTFEFVAGLSFVLKFTFARFLSFCFLSETIHAKEQFSLKDRSLPFLFVPPLRSSSIGWKRAQSSFLQYYTRLGAVISHRLRHSTLDIKAYKPNYTRRLFFPLYNYPIGTSRQPIKRHGEPSKGCHPTL